MLLLLSDRRDGPAAADILRRAGPDVPVRLLVSAEDLEAAAADAPPGARLLAFRSGLVVPERILRALRSNAYNLHPGPPERPGTFPDVFAAYDGDRRFGATLHRMAARVDEGEVVEVSRFDVPAGADRAWYARRAGEAAASMLARRAADLARTDVPLAPGPAAPWSGRKTRMADVLALAEVSADTPADELRRRARALRGLPEAPLRLTLRGRSFVADPDPTASALWPFS
jgi:methionyl-tRNA formyltransferase